MYFYICSVVFLRSFISISLLYLFLSIKLKAYIYAFTFTHLHLRIISIEFIGLFVLVAALLNRPLPLRKQLQTKVYTYTHKICARNKTFRSKVLYYILTENNLELLLHNFLYSPLYVESAIEGEDVFLPRPRGR